MRNPLQDLSDDELAEEWERRRDTTDATRTALQAARGAHEDSHNAFVDIETEYRRRKRVAKHGAP